MLYSILGLALTATAYAGPINVEKRAGEFKLGRFLLCLLNFHHTFLVSCPSILAQITLAGGQVQATAYCTTW